MLRIVSRSCKVLGMVRSKKQRNFLLLVVILVAISNSLGASSVSADQNGGREIYKNYWRYGERNTITECVGLVNYKSWGRTRLSGPPEIQVKVADKWKTVAKSKIVPNSDGCVKLSEFPVGVKVDKAVLVSFSWTVNQIGEGAPDTRYSSCAGSARQLQIQNLYPNSPYPPRPRVVIVCS
jgi:hypothetical protein